MKIQSNKENLAAPQERVYDTLLRFTQLTQQPPIPQISNWSADGNGCSFTINDMVTCRFLLTEQVPCSKVCYHIDTDKNLSADAVIHIGADGTGSTVQLEAEADVPVFLQPVVKGPVERSVNMVLARIKELAERSL